MIYKVSFEHTIGREALLLAALRYHYVEINEINGHSRIVEACASSAADIADFKRRQSSTTAFCRCRRRCISFSNCSQK